MLNITSRSITTSTMPSQEQDGEEVGEELEEEVGEEVGEKDRDEVREAGEEVGHKCGDKIAVQPVPCFELCYEDKIKARVFAEIIFTEDGLGFVPFVMNQFAFVSWLLRCTGLRKPKPGCDRATDLVGIHKMKELRNQITVRLQAGVRDSAHVGSADVSRLDSAEVAPRLVKRLRMRLKR